MVRIIANKNDPNSLKLLIAAKFGEKSGNCKVDAIETIGKICIIY